MCGYLSLFSLWRSPALCFYTAFLHQSSYFFSLTWGMVGHFSALLLLSVLHHSLQFGFESIWPGKIRHCACMTCCKSDWHFSDTPFGSDWFYLARSGRFLQIKLQPLGGATDSWPVSCSTVRSLWQTSKYNQNIVTVYSFNVDAPPHTLHSTIPINDLVCSDCANQSL